MSRYLGDVLPSPPFHDGADVRAGATVLTTEGSEGFTFARAASDIAHLLLGKARVAIAGSGAWCRLSKTGAIGVQRVPAAVGPLQIVNTVVTTVAIEVVHMWKALGWFTKKSESNKAVNPLGALFVVLAQHKLMVSVAFNQFSKSARVGARCIATASHPAKIGHLVGVLIPNDGSPRFCKGHVVKLTRTVNYV